MRRRADSRRSGALRRWARAAATAALLFAASAADRPAWGQPTPVPPAEAPAAPEVAPAPERPSAPVEEERPRALAEEALEEIDRALEEVEERLEEEAEAGDEDGTGAITREQRERVREIREQVRRRVRERTDRSDNKVAFGSSIRIAEGEVARDVVAIGGSIRIEGDVYGDVVAVGGPITIDGRVTGDVVAVGGGVDLRDDAEVLGEVTSVGGRVVRAEGAEVIGRINEVAFGPSFTWRFGDADVDWWDWNDHWRFRPFRFEWFGFALSLTMLIVLLLFACLIRLVAGGTVERARARIVESPWLCGLVGLAIELFFVPVLVVVCVILAISLIGIPLLLLIPFVVLAFLVAMLVGYSSAALAVGYWAQHRFGWNAAGPYAAIAIGVLLIQSLHIAGELFDSFDGFLWIFAVMFGIVGFLVRYAAWTVGLGALFLGAVRASSQRAVLPPAASPPPSPPSPAPLPPAAPPPPPAEPPPY